ncbi:MAG TPA: arylsulfotransferase family protein [Solirubrobacteraceae bacterium]|nr:arylsulfotransferase family protein [Solirubrobacteraceae bacterium]
MASAVGADLILGGRGGSRRLPVLGSSADEPSMRFDSRPDLRPPGLKVSGETAPPGALLLGPGSQAQLTQQGPMLIDGRGELVWFSPLAKGVWATNVSVASYRGAPALAWWEGKVIAPGFGQGEAVIVDGAYRELARVRAGNGLQMDLHELQLTAEGTALFTCYPPTVAADLSAVGGPVDGRVQESVIQEVDLASGRVLVEWHSLDHIPVTDSYKPLGEPYDYLHVNSVSVAPDGNLLVSARHTWALYKLERRTGRIMWQLGGKRSDFAMGRGARFSWQHDARAVSNAEVTLFDDGSDGPQTTESESRGLVLALDVSGRRVSVGRQYHHPHPLSASAMGSFQQLDDGHALVGWGTAPYVSEFGPDGTLLWDAELPPHLYTYRARRSSWVATPSDRPAARVGAGVAGAARDLYVSWNGATAVTHWMLSRGARPDRLSPVGIARRAGFETAIPIQRGGYVAAAALDQSGRELARSAPVRA